MKERSKAVDVIVAIVECAMMIALASVLNMFKFFRMPQGGSVHAVSMLPLVFIGLRRGPKWGFFGCTVYGILHFLLDGGFALNVASIFLDYIFAYAAIGVAGFFRGKKNGIWFAMPAAVFSRFIFLFIAGVTIWKDYAGETPVVLYSIIYNGPFLLAELVLMYVVALALKPALPRLLTIGVRN